MGIDDKPFKIVNSLKLSTSDPAKLEKAIREINWKRNTGSH